MDGSLAISIPMWEENVGTPDGPKVCDKLCPSFGSEVTYNRLIHIIHWRPV